MNWKAPHKDLLLRIDRIQQLMNKDHNEGMLLTCSVNLYYSCSTVFNGYLFIPSIGQPHAFLKREVPYMPYATTIIRKVEDIPVLITNSGYPLPKELYLECDELSYNEVERIRRAFENPILSNATVLLRQCRTCKSPWELEQLHYSARMHEKTYDAIKSCYKEGMTDSELQHRIEYIMRQNGSIGLFKAFGNNMDIFMGSLLAGSNAAIPSPFDFALGGQGTHPILPVGANGTRLRTGTSIMVDMAGNYCGYMTDMTRVYSIGRLSELAYYAHSVALEIQADMMSYAKIGVSCSEIYNRTLDYVKRAKLESYFMGTTQQAKFVGHGIGLQINELPVLTPRSNDVLMEHMVFAFEPKFVIPDVGAVGIENSFVVGQNGVCKLTLFPEEIVDLSTD